MPTETVSSSQGSNDDSIDGSADVSSTDDRAKKRRRDDSTSTATQRQPAIRHVLLSSSTPKAQQSAKKAVEVSLQQSKVFDNFFHITRHSVGDVVLSRLGKLDRHRLWDPKDTGRDSDDKKPAKLLETDAAVFDGGNEKEDSTTPSKDGDDADGNVVARDEQTDGDSGPFPTAAEDPSTKNDPPVRLLFRSFVKPQKDVEMCGSEVVVRLGPHKGFVGTLKKKLSSGYCLIRGTDVGVCTAHISEIDYYRPRGGRTKRKGPSSARQSELRQLQNNAGSSFLAALSSDGEFVYGRDAVLNRARTTFHDAGVFKRRGRRANKPES